MYIKRQRRFDTVLNLISVFFLLVFVACNSSKSPHQVDENEIQIENPNSTLDNTQPNADLDIDPNKSRKPGQFLIKVSESPGSFTTGTVAKSWRTLSTTQALMPVLKQTKQTPQRILQADPNNTLSKWQLVTLNPGVNENEFLRQISSDPGVVKIEPNYIVSVKLQPTDPRFGELWGMHNTGQNSATPGIDIKAPMAWDTQTGSNQVVVAVIDTGVDYTHEDLAANMWVNGGEIANNGIDDDGNGYIDDVYGYRFINGVGSANPMDDYGHGTHVAGTIAAVANNGLGVAGVSWNAKIMALKFLGADGYGTTYDAIQSVLYAVQNGAHIMNNSWGGGGYSEALKESISVAHRAGIVFVAAAGNAGLDTDTVPHYPSSYQVPNVVSVAALDLNGNRASFSNYGQNTVDLAAPGVSILSTVPTGNCALCDPSGYAFLKGTSMATPHVAGVAALVYSSYPQLSGDAVRQLLMASVTPLDSMQGITVTGGMLNAAAALNDVDFVFSMTPERHLIEKGIATRTYDVTVQWLNGNTTAVNLSAASDTAAISLSLDNSSVTPGQNATANVVVTAQTTAQITTGRHNLVISASNGQQNMNNTVQLYATDVDITVDSISAPNAWIMRSDLMNVSADIRNLGAGKSGLFRVGFYLSPDNDVNTGDIFLGEAYTQLGPQEMKNVSASVYVSTWYNNAVLQEGDYYIGAIADFYDSVIEFSEDNNNSQGSPIALSVGADMTVTDVVVPNNLVCDGEGLKIPVEITNIGQAWIEDYFTVDVYASADATLDASSDVMLGSATASIYNYYELGPNMTTQVIVGMSYGIPCSQLPVGNYYIGAIIDADNRNRELNENNNSAVSNPIQVQQGLPDMVVTAINGPTRIDVGTWPPFRATVRNQGNGMGANYIANIYLSTDTQIDATDIRICSTTAPGTSVGYYPGSASNITCSNYFNQSVPAGIYYIGIVLDPDNLISESDENNNSYVGSQIGVGVDGPVTHPVGVDLVVSDISTPVSIIGYGEELPMNLTVENRGDSSAGWVYVYYYLSTDPVITTDDTRVGIRQEYLFGADSKSWSPVRWNGASLQRLPVTLAAGTYYLGAIADPMNTIVEFNETNNSTLGTQISIVNGADLVMTQLLVKTAQIATGQSFTITSTIRNQGSTVTKHNNQRVGLVDVSVYLSNDSTITSEDIKIGGSRVIMYIDAGDGYSSDMVVKVPVNTVPGSYYIGVLADSDQLIPETDESNNSLTGPLMQVSIGADLAMTYVSSENQGATGAGFNVNANFQNVGVGEPNNSVKVEFFLSQDMLYDSGDTRIGLEDLGKPLAGDNRFIDKTYTLPTSLSAGSYTLIAVVDPANTVTEVDDPGFDSNNVAIGNQVNVTVGADLTVTTAASQDIVYTGGILNLTGSVQNIGIGSSSGYARIYTYLSQDSIFDTADTRLSSYYSVSGLAPGLSRNFTINSNLTSAVESGNYSLFVVVDPDNTVAESDDPFSTTGNNVRFVKNIAIEVGADIQMNSVSGPVTASPGNYVPLTAEAQNSGLGNSLNYFSVYFYLSTDQVFDAADISLTGYQYIGYLSTGRTYPINRTFGIPTTTPAGTYYILAVADPQNQLLERDDPDNLNGNNLAVGNQITIQ